MRQSSQKLKNQLQVRRSRHWTARACVADPAIGYRLPPFDPIAALVMGSASQIVNMPCTVEFSV